MKYREPSRGNDKWQFSRSASKIHPRNGAHPQRTGIRL